MQNWLSEKHSFLSIVFVASLHCTLLFTCRLFYRAVQFLFRIVKNRKPRGCYFWPRKHKVLFFIFSSVVSVTLKQKLLVNQHSSPNGRLQGLTLLFQKFLSWFAQYFFSIVYSLIAAETKGHRRANCCRILISSFVSARQTKQKNIRALQRNELNDQRDWQQHVFIEALKFYR